MSQQHAQYSVGTLTLAYQNGTEGAFIRIIGKTCEGPISFLIKLLCVEPIGQLSSLKTQADKQRPVEMKGQEVLVQWD